MSKTRKTRNNKLAYQNLHSILNAINHNITKKTHQAVVQKDG